MTWVYICHIPMIQLLYMFSIGFTILLDRKSFPMSKMSIRALELTPGLGCFFVPKSRHRARPVGGPPKIRPRAWQALGRSQDSDLPSGQCWSSHMTHLFRTWTYLTLTFVLLLGDCTDFIVWDLCMYIGLCYSVVDMTCTAMCCY